MNTYDTIKTAKSQGETVTPAMLDEAISIQEKGVADLAVKLARAQGVFHAATKSPFPVEEAHAAFHAAGGEFGEALRRLSKLVSWRERGKLNLPEVGA
jgi:hypothetical protein